MSDTTSNSLAVPWIIVIILSVVVAAESVYLFTVLRKSRPYGGGREHARPRTEWYELSRGRDRGPEYRPSGYKSPIEPPGVRWRA